MPLAVFGFGCRLIGMTRIIAALAVAGFSGISLASDSTDAKFEVDAARPQVRMAKPDSEITLDNVTVKYAKTGETITMSKLAVTKDDASGDCLITFPGYENGVLPDGEYVITAGGLTGSFFVLSGDVNRDRKVDSLDFNIISGNFGVVAATHSNGDLNYDGTVDSKDLNIFTAQNGKSLSAATSQPATASTTQPTTQPE